MKPLKKVWSADTEKTHSPPADLVMKGQSWHLEDHNTCVLIDQKGDVCGAGGCCGGGDGSSSGDSCCGYFLI